MRRGKTIGEPLKHDTWVMSVHMSHGNQQVISLDSYHKVYLWSASTGELLETAADSSGYSRLLWRGINRRNGEENVGVERSNEKPQIAVFEGDVYTCEPTRTGGIFEKVGQFDDWAEDWVIDAKGNLWACLVDGKVARLKLVL